MRLRSLLSVILGMIPIAGFSHGEDKLGPNGGFIRMPGGFHTGVLISQGELQVFLLDLSFRSPTTKNSSVNVEYISEKTESQLVCFSNEKNFSCKLPKAFNPKAGFFNLVAVRDGVKGSVAKYELPLKLSPPASVPKDDHSKHH